MTAFTCKCPPTCPCAQSGQPAGLETADLRSALARNTDLENKAGCGEQPCSPRLDEHGRTVSMTAEEYDALAAGDQPE
jgi:hypothetical protein